MDNNLSRRKFLRRTAMATAAIVSASYIKSFANISKTNKHKIFIFSKHFHWLDYTQMAREVKKYGFDGIDLTVRPNGHVLPENVERDLPLAIEAIRKEGLIIDTITTAIIDASDPKTLKIIETAKNLGIKQYRLGWFEYDKNMGIPENLNQIKSKFQEISKLNKKYGLRADYQNHSGTGFGSSVWDIYEVFKEIDTQWLGVRFDIRHAVTEGAYSWPIGLKLIKPFIRSLDFKDFIWDYDAAKHSNMLKGVPLGQGTVNFGEYCKLIEEYKLDYNVTLHMEYELGGAENGDKTITINPETFYKALKSDLEFIKMNLGQ